MGEKSGKSTIGKTSNDSALLKELRKLINDWCQRNQTKQLALATECGIDAADLNHFLSSERQLPQYAVANLAVQLRIDPARLLLRDELERARTQYDRARPDDPQDQNASSSTNNQRARQLAEYKRRGWELTANAFSSILEQPPSDDAARMSASRPGTLVDWPAAFLPLVVFGGRTHQKLRQIC